MNRTPFVAVPFCLFATACALGPSAAAAAPDGARLALLKPANQWLKQGSTNRINLIVRRTGFSDPVDVNFLNLPAGVRVEGNSIPEGASTRDFVIVADENAAIVADQPVTIEVHSHGLTTSQAFELSVKAK
jgi:hypothetical protein